MSNEYPTNQYNTQGFTTTNKQLAYNAETATPTAPVLLVDEAPVVLRFFNPLAVNLSLELCTVGNVNGVELLQPYIEHGASFELNDTNTVLMLDTPGNYKLRVKGAVNAGLSGVYAEAVRSKIAVTPKITLVSQTNTVEEQPRGLYSATLPASGAWATGATPYKQLDFSAVGAHVDGAGLVYAAPTDTFSCTSGAYRVEASLCFVPTGLENCTLVVMNTSTSEIVASMHYKGNAALTQSGDEVTLRVTYTFQQGSVYAVMLVNNGTLPDVVRNFSRIDIFKV